MRPRAVRRVLCHGHDRREQDQDVHATVPGMEEKAAAMIQAPSSPGHMHDCLKWMTATRHCGLWLPPSGVSPTTRTHTTFHDCHGHIILLHFPMLFLYIGILRLYSFSISNTDITRLNKDLKAHCEMRNYLQYCNRKGIPINSNGGTRTSECCQCGAWYPGAILQMGRCYLCRHYCCSNCLVWDNGLTMTVGDYVRASMRR